MRRVVRRAAMERQPGAHRHVAPARMAPLAQLSVARGCFGRGEHPVVEVVAVVPVRAGGDLEGRHLRSDVDGRDVEGQRGEPPVAPRLRRGGEVTVPGLVGSAR